MRASSATKNLFNPMASLRKRRRHGFRHRHDFFSSAAAQFEFQPPTFGTDVRNAPELQCANLGQHCLQMHGDTTALAADSFQHSMDWSQGLAVVADWNDVARVFDP